MKYRINERMILIRILVVMGKNILKFPLSITMSPGNFPGKGNRGAKCISIPAQSRIIPVIIRNLAIFKTIKRATDAWITKENCF